MNLIGISNKLFATIFLGVFCVIFVIIVYFLLRTSVDELRIWFHGEERNAKVLSVTHAFRRNRINTRNVSDGFRVTVLLQNSFGIYDTVSVVKSYSGLPEVLRFAYNLKLAEEHRFNNTEQPDVTVVVAQNKLQVSRFPGEKLYIEALLPIFGAMIFIIGMILNLKVIIGFWRDK